ncbi:hypothetical protein [Pedobacter xixiisoli]|nr:hypothetical protein [Pedobacter xixiisoli]
MIFGTRTKLLSAFGTQQTCAHCNTGKLNLVFATHKGNALSQADINDEAVFGKLDANFTPSTFKMAKRNIKSMTKNNKNLVAIFRK